MKRSIGKPAIGMAILLAIAIGAGITMFARRNTPNYSDPGYLDYKKNVEYCNSFYGGDKIPDRDKTVYEAWQNHEPIGC